MGVLALAFVGIALWGSSLGDKTGLPASSSASQALLGCYGLALAALGALFAWCAAARHANRNRALLEDKLTERIFNGRRLPITFAVCLGGSMLIHLAFQIRSLCFVM